MSTSVAGPAAYPHENVLRRKVVGTRLRTINALTLLKHLLLRAKSIQVTSDAFGHSSRPRGNTQGRKLVDSRDARYSAVLLGVIAQRAAVITRQELAEAIERWQRDPVLPFDEILPQCGRLDLATRDALQTQVRRLLARHRGNLQRCLEELQPLPASVAQLFHLEGNAETLSIDGHNCGERGVAARDIAAAGYRELAGESALTHSSDMPAEPHEGEVKSSGEEKADPPGVSFTIERLLAVGGLGEVYIARDASLNREVALKRIRSRLEDNPQSRARFEFEARITASLEHPSIVPIYASGKTADGCPFYTMRLIQGTTLEDAIERFHQGGGVSGNPSRLRQLLGHLVATCHAVAYAHTRGVLHRDIKPSNILLGNFGQTLLVDWGLAKPIGGADVPERTADVDEGIPQCAESSVAATRAGTAIGTPGYMSPEQAEGHAEALGPASDVYGLGATLYCLLTGQAPQSSGNDAVTGPQQSANASLASPKMQVKGLFRTLEAICLKAMARQPSDRYPSASALAEDLEHYLAGEPVRGVREGIGPRLTRWEQRNRVLIRIGGAALLALAVVTSAATFLVNTTREQVEQRRAEAEDQRSRADRERATAEMLLARMALDRGLRMCNDNHGCEGLQWIIRSMEFAPQDRELQRVARCNVDGWMPYQHQLRAILTHPKPIRSLAISPEGRWVLTGSEDGLARVWDSTAGSPYGADMRHEAAIHAVAFSPDGRLILTASDDGTARIWSSDSNHRQVFVLRHSAAVVAACWSAEGQVVATGSADGTAQLWEADTGSPLCPPFAHKSSVSQVHFSRDGRRLFTAVGDGTVHGWTVGATAEDFVVPADGFLRAMAVSADDRMLALAGSGGSIRCLQSSTGERLGDPFGISEHVNVLLFAGDGRLLTGSDETMLRVWDAATQTAIGQPLKQQGPVQALALNGDQTLLASGGGDNTARIWRVSDLSAIGGPLSHPAAVSDVVFLAERRTLVTLCLDGAARIWDLAPTVGEQAAFQLPAAVRAPLAFRRDGKMLAVCSNDGTICLYDVDQGQVRAQCRRHERNVVALTATPDGRSFISAGDDGRIHIWDAESGQLRFDSPDSPLLNAGGPVRKAAVAPDSRRLATATLNGLLQVWDLKSGKSLGGPWHLNSRATSLAFSPDGQDLILGLATGEIALWDVASGGARVATAGHQDAVRELAVSPDGRIIASASADNTARMFRADTLAPFLAPMSHPAWVWTIRFSPDGRQLLTACFDGTARLWDVATGQLRGEPLRHDDMVNIAVFSPDGRTVATGGRDRAARLWDAATGFQIGPTLPHADAVYSVAFHPDGSLLATTGPDRAVHFWRVPRATEGTTLQLRSDIEHLSSRRPSTFP